MKFLHSEFPHYDILKYRYVWSNAALRLLFYYFLVGQRISKLSQVPGFSGTQTSTKHVKQLAANLSFKNITQH